MQDKLRDQAAAIPMPMRRPPSDDKAAKHGLTRSRTASRRPLSKADIIREDTPELKQVTAS